MAEISINESLLDWSELQQMLGKPVFVQYHTLRTGGWALIDFIDDKEIRLTIPSGLKLTFFIHQLGKTWHAYREEWE